MEYKSEYITPDMHKIFWRDGYIYLPNFFHPSDIARIRAQYLDIFVPQLINLGILPDDTLTNNLTSHEIYNAIACMRDNNSQIYYNCRKEVKRALPIQQLALDQRLLTIIRELGISEPTLHERPQLAVDPSNTHSKDQKWKIWKPSINAIAAYINLDNNKNKDNDLFSLVPGSHIAGLRLTESINNIRSEAFVNPATGDPIEYDQPNIIIDSSKDSNKDSNKDSSRESSKDSSKDSSISSIYNTDYIKVGDSSICTDITLFSPIMVSRLHKSSNNLGSIIWCYGDRSDTFYKDNSYSPSVGALITEAMLDNITNHI